MTDDDRYFHQRAEHALHMARRAQSPAAVAAHYTLANRYLDLIHRKPEVDSEHRD